MNHFKLTSNFFINVNKIKLYQIQATRDSLHAKEGELGGYIEKEENLSENAWVYWDARVSDKALILDKA